jgi:hypothetical protein
MRSGFSFDMKPPELKPTLRFAWTERVGFRSKIDRAGTRRRAASCVEEAFSECAEISIWRPAAAPPPGSTSLCSAESLCGVSAPGGVTIGLTRAERRSG